jgi:hypothetical protein
LQPPRCGQWNCGLTQKIALAPQFLISFSLVGPDRKFLLFILFCERSGPNKKKKIKKLPAYSPLRLAAGGRNLSVCDTEQSLIGA